MRGPDPKHVNCYYNIFLMSPNVVGPLIDLTNTGANTVGKQPLARKRANKSEIELKVVG